MQGHNFASLRSVETGSWLGRAFQGQGLGKEMRQAILHLAFEGLGAEEAHSGAFHDNAPSLATSRSVGYAENGETRACGAASLTGSKECGWTGPRGRHAGATTSRSSGSTRASPCSSLLRHEKRARSRPGRSPASSLPKAPPYREHQPQASTRCPTSEEKSRSRHGPARQKRTRRSVSPRLLRPSARYKHELTEIIDAPTLRPVVPFFDLRRGERREVHLNLVKAGLQGGTA